MKFRKSKNKYKKGSWNLICDRTGFKIKAEDARVEWNGLVVDKGVYESRHPQDFVQARADDQSVPYSRPESPERLLGINEVTPDDL